MTWWMWLIIIIVGIGWLQKYKDKQTAERALNNAPYTTPKPVVAPLHTSAATNTEPEPISPRKYTPPSRLHFWPVCEGCIYVAGTKHYQSALKALAGDHGNTRVELYCVAHLVPDSSNAHDDEAIRVDIDGHTVGHLSREEARSYRKRLARKKMRPEATQCAAKIWGGFDRSNEPSSYGVEVFIKPFSTSMTRI